MKNLISIASIIGILMLPTIKNSVDAAETRRDIHTKTYLSGGVLYEALDLKPIVSGAIVFSDISGSFAKANIQEFANKGMIRGYADGTFRPDSPITRAEFLALAINSLGIVVNTGSMTTTLPDIPEDWMIKYFVKGKALGIINGQVINNELKFRPNDSVTRAEALAMLFKAAKIMVPVTKTTEFTDIPSEGTWMIGYITKAKELGIASGQMMNGTPIFRPNDPMTRAESVRIIVNTEKNIGK